MCNSGKDRQEQFLADDEKLEKIAEYRDFRV